MPWLCNLIAGVIWVVCARVMTTTIGLVLYSACVMVTTHYFFMQTDSVIMRMLWVLHLMVLVPLFAFLSRKMPFDWSGRVLSAMLPVHMAVPMGHYVRDGDRVMGRVLPYSRGQLRWNGKPIICSETAASGGTLISGASGSGKTWSMLSMVRQALTQGRNVFFLEFKGDLSLCQGMLEQAKALGYRLLYVLPDGRTNFNYDPLRNLNHSGRCEAVINMRKWSLDGSDAHYRTGTLLLLQRTMSQFGKQWEAGGGKGSFTLGYLQYLKTLQVDRSDSDGLLTITRLLEILVGSQLEPVWKGRNAHALNMESVRAGGKWMFVGSFPSANKELATSFTSLLLRDLLDTFTAQPPRVPLHLFMDEFGTLDNPFIVKDLLEKGRSAGIATVLSLQDIHQIVIQTNEAYLNSLLGTINTFVVHAGGTRLAAEKFAGVQLFDIEDVLMNLRKPLHGKSPTACLISKYPTLNHKSVSEVFRYEPYVHQLNGSSALEGEVPHHGGMLVRCASVDPVRVEPMTVQKDGTAVQHVDLESLI